MFTGLIQDVGQIVAAEKKGRDMVVRVKPSRLQVKDMALGASIACNGVCLTVTETKDGFFTVYISGETLDKTTAGSWQTGMALNLEPSLKMGDELGGHMVYGHVDGVGKCVDVNTDGAGTRFVFEVSSDLSRFIAVKGSISINGVSLTVNEVRGNQFGVMIIPHTIKETTFGSIQTGSPVNIEIDMLARYVARMNDCKSECA